MGVVILGGGLAGLSCAWHLLQRGAECSVHEARGEPGGKARTRREAGFSFDRTGHWLHLRDEGMRRWVETLLGGDLLEVERVARIRSHGAFTRYPFQANTHGLPPEVVQACVVGFVDALRRRDRGDDPPPTNLREALLQWFGAGIAEHFMLPYNEKLWGVPATEITAAWCSRFVPRPTLAEVVGGAVGAHAEGLGYNPRFVYPASGGIDALARAIAADLGEALHTDDPAVAVHWSEGEVEFGDGRRRPYERLVSTAPLPTLVRLLTPAPPAEVLAASARLRATSVAYVDYGVRGPDNRGAHWIYFPEAEAPFYRVGSYSNVNPRMAPDGHGSLYVETSLGPDGAPPAWDVELPAIRSALVRYGLIDSEEAIVLERPRTIRGAYVLFDHAHAEARRQVLDWVEARGIEPIGRYGRWTYSSMEDALIEGRRAGGS